MIGALTAIHAIEIGISGCVREALDKPRCAAGNAIRGGCVVRHARDSTEIAMVNETQSGKEVNRKNYLHNVSSKSLTLLMCRKSCESASRWVTSMYRKTQ